LSELKAWGIVGKIRAIISMQGGLMVTSVLLCIASMCESCTSCYLEEVGRPNVHFTNGHLENQEKSGYLIWVPGKG
jgi:hypothetical protein